MPTSIAGLMPQPMRPRYWGIAARSAFVSATVVLVALTVAGAVLAAVLYQSLLSGLDATAAARVRDVASALQSDAPADLDPSLLATDEGIEAVQVIDSAGVVVSHSNPARDALLVPPATVADTLRVGMGGNGAPRGDVRVAAQTVQTPRGRYTVLVGVSNEAVESKVLTVALGLAVAAPIVIAVSGLATYWLVRRSLRSVEAIRARVAEISASDLAERVPVPGQRDEISALAATMNEMLSRIESGQAAQRRFVGDASHELRSPLATVISALEVGVAHPELLNEHMATTALLPEAHRMQSLVEDLLLLARADERELSLRHDDVDLDDLAAAETERLRRESSLTIESDLLPTRVVGDPGGLSRVLRNLLDNAARHASARVRITVRPDGDNAELTVADDGPGIPSADRARVFDRFVRLDTDRARSGGGTGLGLAIVAEIIAAHGGKVNINDRAGDGAVLVVQLPLAASAASGRGR